MVWLGLKTAHRKRWALWAGTGYSLFILLVVLGFLFLPIQYDAGGLYSKSDPQLRLVVHMLFLTLATIQLLAFVVALIAYYANLSAYQESLRG